MQNKKSEIKNGFSLVNWVGKIDRFGQDILGIFLILLGLLSFLGLFRISNGLLIDRWTSLIEKGFGWGAYLAAGFLIYVGLLILLRRIENAPHLNLNRILALEGFLFIFLILLAIFGEIEPAFFGMTHFLSWFYQFPILNYFDFRSTHIEKLHALERGHK